MGDLEMRVVARPIPEIEVCDMCVRGPRPLLGVTCLLIHRWLMIDVCAV
jgi:hypothetical protein